MWVPGCSPDPLGWTVSCSVDGLAARVREWKGRGCGSWTLGGLRGGSPLVLWDGLHGMHDREHHGRL